MAGEPLPQGDDWCRSALVSRADAVDVTGPRLTPHALGDPELHSRELFETAQDGILILDADTGRIVDANPFVRTLLGYSYDELVGRYIAEIGLFADVETSQAAFRRLQEVGYLRYEDLPLRTRPGQWFDVELVNNVYSVLCTIRDVTARKRAEEALRESVEHTHFLADAMPQMVWMADANGSINYLSRLWRTYTGLDVAELRGWGWRQIIHPDDWENTVRIWQRSIATGNDFQLEQRCRRHDGVYRWHLSRGLALREPDGGIRMWVGTHTDIDDQKRTEAMLKESEVRKDEFLAMLAHELRNPLAPIVSAIQVLRVLGPPDEQQQAAREIILRQTHQLTRLVDDLLDISRIARGKITLRKEPVQVSTLVTRALEISRPLIDARRHQLEVVLPSEPGEVHGDAVRLTQVISNLLNNAAKYTDEGGHIRLTVESAEGEVLIRVRDTGIGIAPETIPTVFDMFTQAAGTRERAQGGLGVGLTLVNTIVNLHGGTVEAFSEGLGKGSEFVVRLPLLVAERPSGGPTAAYGSDEDAAPKRRRVLVVDDNRDCADALSMLVRLFGHDVRTAYDGPQALALAEAFQPDVALLDLGLPGTSGYEVGKRIRAIPGLERVRLVAVSGFGTERDFRRTQESGFDRHLIKPAAPHTIKELLGSLPDRAA